jgi:hypothetical protein
VVEVAARMGWSSAVVKKELKNLEWASSGSGWKKTGHKWMNTPGIHEW